MFSEPVEVGPKIVKEKVDASFRVLRLITPVLTLLPTAASLTATVMEPVSASLTSPNVTVPTPRAEELGLLRGEIGAARWAAFAARRAAMGEIHAAIVSGKDDGMPMERAEGGILVKFKNGDVRVPDAMVLDALLDKEAAAQADAAKSAAVKKRLDERKKYVEEIKALAEWRNRKKDTTKHFDFESTVPPNVFAEFRDTMEAYYTEFSKLWSIKQPKDGRLLVCFYGDEGTFHQVSGAGYGILGYFRFVKPLELDIYYDRLDPELTEDVMFHEANHYLQKLLNPQVNMPHFPGESLAEYYGASAYDAKTKKLTVGLMQRPSNSS